MDPLDNLALAQDLNRNARGALEEARRRAVCGRAYYAAFAFARDLMIRARITLAADHATHQDVINHLKLRSTLQEVRAAGLLLDSLRATRNSADYQVGQIPIKGRPFDGFRSGAALAQAKNIIDTLAEEAKRHPRLGIP